MVGGPSYTEIVGALVLGLSGVGGLVAWWVKRVATRADETRDDLLKYKTEVAEKFATKDMLTTLHTEIRAEFSEFRRFIKEDLDRLLDVLKHKE